MQQIGLLSDSKDRIREKEDRSKESIMMHKYLKAWKQRE